MTLSFHGELFERWTSFWFGANSEKDTKSDELRNVEILSDSLDGESCTEMIVRGFSISPRRRLDN